MVIRIRDIWKLYWVRSDGNWHKYDRAAEVGSLDKALVSVDEVTEEHGRKYSFMPKFRALDGRKVSD